MNQQLARRLQKLEEKYAKQSEGVISRIDWLMADDKRGPGVRWIPAPDQEEPASQLSLNFGAPTKFHVEPGDECRPGVAPVAAPDPEELTSQLCLDFETPPEFQVEPPEASLQQLSIGRSDLFFLDGDYIFSFPVGPAEAPN